MPLRRSLVALLALLLVPSACQVPRFEGPQIQEPPLGFLLQPESYSQRRIFPDREVSFHTAWVHTDVSGVSLIYVDEHPGTVDVADVMGALEDARENPADPDVVVGEIEALRIDGRDAWGWYEHVGSPSRGLVEVTYNAVIPYDSVTYAIEFVSGEPSWKAAAPDTLRAVIGSFGIGRTTYNLPLIAIIFGSLILGASMLRARAKERATRLQSINLVTIPKKEQEEQASDSATGGVAATEGAPTPSPAPSAAPQRAAAPAPPTAAPPPPAPPRPPSGESPDS